MKKWQFGPIQSDFRGHRWDVGPAGLCRLIIPAFPQSCKIQLQAWVAGWIYALLRGLASTPARSLALFPAARTGDECRSVSALSQTLPVLGDWRKGAAGTEKKILPWKTKWFMVLKTLVFLVAAYAMHRKKLDLSTWPLGEPPAMAMPLPRAFHWWSLQALCVGLGSFPGASLWNKCWLLSAARVLHPLRLPSCFLGNKFLISQCLPRLYSRVWA